MTSAIVSRKVKHHAESIGLEVLRRPAPKPDKIGDASRLLDKLRAATVGHANGNRISLLLDEVMALMG